MPAITIYTTPTCPWCKKTKDYLKTKGLSYREINVAEDDRAAFELLEKSGQMGVPVTDIDGTIVIGFDKAALDNALAPQA